MRLVSEARMRSWSCCPWVTRREWQRAEKTTSPLFEGPVAQKHSFCVLVGTNRQPPWRCPECGLAMTDSRPAWDPDVRITPVYDDPTEGSEVIMLADLLLRIVARTKDNMHQ
jgi:hypothetical protein